MYKDVAMIHDQIAFYGEHFDVQYALKTPHQILCKAMEELGEVSEILNKPEEVFEESLEAEVCDVVNAVVDLAYTLMKLKDPLLTPSQFAHIMKAHQSKKIAKWQRKEINRLTEVAHHE